MTYDHWKITNPDDRYLGDPGVAVKDRSQPWNGDSEYCRQVFCAALQGFIIRGAEPKEAVELADSVVLAAVYR